MSKKEEEEKKTKKTLKSRVVGSVLYGFGTFGKRPKLQLKDELFYPDGELLQYCLDLDLALNLVRVLLQTLFCVDVENHTANEQYVLSWNGFHAMVVQAVPSSPSIGYCPVINGNQTEYSTVYTFLETVQIITYSIFQALSDLAIYLRATEE